MPSWTLILFMTMPGAEPVSLPVGLLINRQACNVAGAGMVQILSAATPEAVINWACVPAGEGA